MKLNATQINDVEKKLGGFIVPEEHPANSDLKGAFGDHTFFVDGDGLNIVETDAAEEDNVGVVVKLASWTNEKRTELAPHEPQVRDMTVALDK